MKITHPTYPAAPDLEACLLSAILQQPNKIDEIMLQINAELFFVPQNRIIFEACQQLYNQKDVIDIVTVANKLNSSLNEIGGHNKLIQITLEPHWNYEYAIKILQQKYVRRVAIEIGSELIRISTDDTADELEALQKLDDYHKKLTDLLFGQTAAQSWKDVTAEAYNMLLTRVQNIKKGILPGIDTGIETLTKVIGGWQRGELIVIAGRPGMGKTALALYHAIAAASIGYKVLIYSLEMQATKLADRAIIGGTKINDYRFKMGALFDPEIYEVKTWIEQNQNLFITIDDRAIVSVDYICGSARAKARRGRLDLLFIDYLQLIDVEVERGVTKDQAVGKVTRKLKNLARDINIPIILLSQLNRMVEDRTEKRPTLRDLRESGNIEQDADIVLFCFRPAYYGLKEYKGKPTEGLMIVDVAKNRNGEANIDVYINHNKTLTQFKSI